MSESDSFSVWLLQVLVLSLLLVFFLWLSLRPSAPSYAIVDFSVNTTASLLSFSIEFSNDNRGGRVYYDNINVTVYSSKNDSVVGTTSLASFYQGHEKSTVVMGMVSGKKGRAWNGVAAAVRTGTARLRVGMAAAARYKIWWWRSKVHWVSVEAGVSLDKRGKISEKMKRIKMHKAMKKWRRVCD